MTKKSLSIAVIIPCRNEINYIHELVAAVITQIDVPYPVEIIIADGQSDDGTREVLDQLSKFDKRIKIIDNPARIVSTGLNAAIASTSADIIIRMDVHTEYAQDYVSKCILSLIETGADNVGGPARTKFRSYFQGANSVAYHSVFSVGGASFHNEKYEGWVDTVTYGCWWRKTLLKIGMYDAAFVRNQDDELNLRIVRSGGKIWQSPSILSWYYPRSSFSSLFRQYFQYGYWKVKVIRKHRTPASIRHIVPVTFIFGLIITSIGSLFSHVMLILMIFLVLLYLFCNILASIICCCKNDKFKYLPIVPFVFVGYHFGYGLGFSNGILSMIFAAVANDDKFSDLTR